jgi:hypothetical protein
MMPLVHTARPWAHIALHPPAAGAMPVPRRHSRMAHRTPSPESYQQASLPAVPPVPGPGVAPQAPAATPAPVAAAGPVIPLVVVLVDEVAFLTAYHSDKAAAGTPRAIECR